MQELIQEQLFDCPACGARISVLVDLSAGEQTYIEDCEVCCRPLEIVVSPDGAGGWTFEAGTADR